MAPSPYETAWDLGAGCGGVSVEWARWNHTGRIYAVEREAERCEYLKRNRDGFGVSSNMHIIAGEAPQACADLPAPQSIFIGGSGGHLPALLDFAFDQLSPGGKLCASAVTEAGRAALTGFDRGFDALRLTLAVSLEHDPKRRPVLLARFVK